MIAGPTASGKSELAMRLCEALGGELVSADSMQVYRGMDILTAKPTAEERSRLPHHMIDVAEPSQEYSAAMYRDGARAAINDITSRGKVAVMCGGTGLYINAVTRPLSLGARAQDSAVRARYMEQGQDESGRIALFAMLTALDPQCAARLHQNDVRRVARALELIEITGITPSEQVNRDRGQADLYDTRMFAINWSREGLCRRIDKRVDEMIRMGLFEEVARLAVNPISHTASQALGLKEALLALRGELTPQEAVELIRLRTRQYAKRQMTWFRGDRRAVWVEAGPVDSMMDYVLKQPKKRPRPINEGWY